eukprot:TRINITY_DN5769_c3_g1_i1.p1 TRINITY_DN5769_c3_g1~~TRINITY_DN5769_c3_g1_i1.p1  ORF type:complete len:323 (-),score=35.96 TRINITY_DN5769_c3_g1_i1:66-1034(-)
MRDIVGPLHIQHTHAYEHLRPADVGPSPRTPRNEGFIAKASQVLRQQSGSTPKFAAAKSGTAGDGRLIIPVALDISQGAEPGCDVDLTIEAPAKDKKTRQKLKHHAAAFQRPLSCLAALFKERQFPDPIYYRNVECVGVSALLTHEECLGIIEIGEATGFHRQFRPGMLDVQVCDFADFDFAEALWNLSGLGWLLRTVSVDGLVPCGLNEVIRLQKYTQGGLFGRHTDRSVVREDGRVSKYSIRIFLNSDFDGGLSAFHVPFQSDPVIFEPEEGLALLYPQGELCTLQEETEIAYGVKYMLRADVLFCKSEELTEFGGLKNA